MKPNGIFIHGKGKFVKIMLKSMLNEFGKDILLKDVWLGR